MILEISRYELLNQLKKQLSHLFSLSTDEGFILDKSFESALFRCEECFRYNPNKYFKKESEVYFNPYHSVQYMTFLYYMSNSIYKSEPDFLILCDKLYYLNKIMNGVDLFYTVDMPNFFMAEHPVGSVIGKGKIGDGFFFYQCCTIGGYHNADGTVTYPELGENVRLYANSGIIGKCKIGNNVNIGAGTLVKNENIPSNVNVFGQSPNLIIKSIKNKTNDSIL